MSKLSQAIKKYLEENNIGLDEITADLKSIDTDLVEEMLNELWRKIDGYEDDKGRFQCRFTL